MPDRAGNHGFPATAGATSTNPGRGLGRYDLPSGGGPGEAAPLPGPTMGATPHAPHS
ncbi:Hypothetical protein HVIM_04215 [Roseomonas mucosa]|nr:Hypothetical protein HVIM_04215 [Roseomonas mucosa]QDD98962.1 Hypothetical protein ADP8_04215 [Roseomonas mucosa]UZO91155.1 Hypothetical protein RMP42_04215 [Roseomonas mucosa]